MMLMSLFVTLTLVAQANNDDDRVQSFAERLKASHEQKKPNAIEAEDEGEGEGEVKSPSQATREFQSRMTQTVAGRR